MAKSDSNEAGAPAAGDDAELRGGPVMDVAVLSGATFTNKSVTYYDIKGMAIVEGDIALGEVDKVRASTDAARQSLVNNPGMAFGVGITGSQFRWPNCRMPYEIDPNLPNQQRVTDAIAHWETNTSFKFPLRTAANAGQFPNYVRFTDAGGCWSMVGMQGGEQLISLGPNCTTGNTIHEIGHAVGLWHEQSREDRDLFVTIHWENIQSGMAAQFNQHITDGDDLGNYDYGSIMHYPRTAFSSNGNETITPVDPNADIGQRNGLSAGDRQAVVAMYPGCSVVGPQPKNIFERPVFKKIVDENIVKPIPSDIPTKPIQDGPGPIKAARDPIVFPGRNVVIQPQVRPFPLGTPHHAPMAGGQGFEGDQGAAAYVSALQQQVLDLEAAAAQARATAAQATAEAARLEQATHETAQAYTQAVQGLGGGV